MISLFPYKRTTLIFTVSPSSRFSCSSFLSTFPGFFYVIFFFLVVFVSFFFLLYFLMHVIGKVTLTKGSYYFLSAQRLAIFSFGVESLLKNHALMSPTLSRVVQSSSRFIFLIRSFPASTVKDSRTRASNCTTVNVAYHLTG